MSDYDRSVEEEINFRRNQVFKTTEEEACRHIVRMLTEGENGYFVWTALDETARWWYRAPKDTSKDVHMWLDSANKVITMVHICDPIRYIEKAKRGDFRSLASYSGYVHETEARCRACKAPAPPEMKQRLEKQLRVLKWLEKFSGT